MFLPVPHVPCSDGNKITLGRKYRIQTEFSETLFYPLTRTDNGSRIHGETVKTGSTPVVAKFKALKASAELVVYSGIELVPTAVMLPYDPNDHISQKVQFSAMGGDGLFTWTSMNPGLVTVNQIGLADASIDNAMVDDGANASTATITRFAQIKVALSRNNKLFKVADLTFVPPHKLQIVKYNFETALKDYVHLHVAVYALHNNTLMPFTSCDNLHFDLEFSNEIFFVDKSSTQSAIAADSERNACRVIRLRAATLGQTTLKIAHTVTAVANKVLRDEVALVVFEPLSIVNPQENVIVLPIGASRHVIYENGPQRMFNIEAELQSTVEFDRTIVGVTQVQNEHTKDISKYTIFQVLCRRVGETALQYKSFNALATKRYVAYLSEFVTKVFCVKPRFINIYTTEKLRDSCPLTMKTSLMHVKRNDDYLEVSIEVLDAQNRRLMNISSLLVDWQFSQIGGSTDDVQTTNVLHRRESEEELVAGVRVPVRDYLITSLPGVQQNFRIKAAVMGYAERVLAEVGGRAESPAFGIQKVNFKLLFKSAQLQ